MHQSIRHTSGALRTLLSAVVLATTCALPPTSAAAAPQSSSSPSSATSASDTGSVMPTRLNLCRLLPSLCK